MERTHKIYLCDADFSERSASSDEKELRKNSEYYNTVFNKRKELISTSSEITRSHFIGTVDYLPVVRGGNIKDEANILIYIYKGKSIISHVYRNCIESISNFINKNNITSIQLSGDDVGRLIINGMDIVNDITENVSHDINIHVTKQKQSTRGYHLV